MHGNITRRGFLKGGVAVGGAVAAAHFLYGGVETLVGTSPASGAAPELSEELVPTVCWIGKQDCGILARRVGGRVVKLEGNPAHPRNAGTLCPKGIAQISALYDPNRVRTPLIRTNEKGVPGQFRQATWDEALGLVAERIKAARAKNPKLVLWQKGRSKAEPFYDTAFVATWARRSCTTARSAPMPATGRASTPSASTVCSTPITATPATCSTGATT